MAISTFDFGIKLHVVMTIIAIEFGMRFIKLQTRNSSMSKIRWVPAGMTRFAGGIEPGDLLACWMAGPA